MKTIHTLFWVIIGGLGGEVLSLVWKAHAWAQGGLIVGAALLVWLFQRFLFKNLKSISAQNLLVFMISLLVGLAETVLFIGILRPFLTLLTFRERAMAYFWLTLLCTGATRMILAIKFEEICHFFSTGGDLVKQRHETKSQLKIIDTSAIIDGRIADLCKTGFLEGVLIIPNFILTELQKIADSADQLRRNRGRRGLDLLHAMQKENLVTIRILDRDYEDQIEVDAKILRLAREIGAKVVTNDYNLNKVAELYGVQVLNINDLSNAIKPVVIPGEEMVVHVLRDGKEFGQGIGYLEDGTMIVVEGGKNYIGMDIVIMVTSVLQTSAGRMIFAKPKEYLFSKAVP